MLLLPKVRVRVGREVILGELDHLQREVDGDPPHKKRGPPPNIALNSA